MKKNIYILFTCALLASCGGESKKTESATQVETPVEIKSTQAEIKSPLSEELNAIESTIDEINSETENLNSDLDSLINSI